MVWPFSRKAMPPVLAVPGRQEGKGLFSTHSEREGRSAWPNGRDRALALAQLIASSWPTPELLPGASVATMDDTANNFENSIKGQLNATFGTMPEAQVLWYGSQGFIGWQMCAMLFQHWLIEKACTMPAEDAIRKGYDISINDGTEVSADIIDYIKERDEYYNINYEMKDFLRMGRCFGIRVAKFDVKSNDPEYYEKPFNVDGVQPNTYNGIIQIDPYWITPFLSSENATPGHKNFYQPDWWQIGNQRIHRSHLRIFTTGGVPDVLKPSYFYAGVSIPQRIYERVYAAERTANEAPMLAMTKRLTVMYTDIAEAIANQEKFDERMAWWSEAMNNYAVKFAGEGDKIEQHETSLTELDNLTMTQYQICAAIAQVPGTKLMGTQPKGFNSTGNYEEASYHEFLETLQTNDLAPMLKMHHKLVIKSDVMPKFGLTKMIKIRVSWNELDAMTAQEQAAVNLSKSQNDEVLVASGIIDTADARKRLVNDPDSGYNGLSAEPPPMPDLATDPNDPNADPATKIDAITPKPKAPAAPAMKGA